MLSIEAFYYYPDQERVLAEMFRVMAPKARLYILINLYKENPLFAALGRQAGCACARTLGN